MQKFEKGNNQFQIENAMKKRRSKEREKFELGRKKEASDESFQNWRDNHHLSSLASMTQKGSHGISLFISANSKGEKLLRVQSRKQTLKSQSCN